MWIQLDAEFWVSVGDFSKIRDLTKLQLVNLIELNDAEIQKANRDRRLKYETRLRRISEAESIRRACTSELCKRIRFDVAKDFVDRLKVRNVRLQQAAD